MNVTKQRMKVWRAAFKAARNNKHLNLNTKQSIESANLALDAFDKKLGLNQSEPDKEVLNG